MTRRWAWMVVAVAAVAHAAGPRVTLEGETIPIVDALEVVGGVLNCSFTGYYDPEPHMKQMAPFHLRNAAPREALAALERATGLSLARSSRLAFVFGGDGGQRLDTRPAGDWLVELNRITFSHSVRLPLGGVAAAPERDRRLVWLLRAPSDPEAIGLCDVSLPNVVLDNGASVPVPATGWFVPGLELGRLEVALPLTLPPAHTVAQASLTLGLRAVTEVTAAFDLADAAATTKRVEDVEVSLLGRDEGRLRFKVALPAVVPWTDGLPAPPAWRRAELPATVEVRLFGADGAPLLASYSWDWESAPAGQTVAKGYVRPYGSDPPKPVRLEVRAYRAVGPRQAVTVRWQDLPLPPLSVPPNSGMPVVTPAVPPVAAPPAVTAPPVRG